MGSKAHDGFFLAKVVKIYSNQLSVDMYHGWKGQTDSGKTAIELARLGFHLFPGRLLLSHLNVVGGMSCQKEGLSRRRGHSRGGRLAGVLAIVCVCGGGCRGSVVSGRNERRRVVVQSVLLQNV